MNTVTTKTSVPFLDLKKQYGLIKPEIDHAIQQVIESCAFAGGPFVEKFEREFAAYCGADYAIGVGSGTEALWLALLAMGIGEGDEVITVPNTFFATVEAIVMTGATPVLVDVDEYTYTMDPHLIKKAITARTKAIIPVHLYGQICDMDSIMAVAEEHGFYVLEDSCQAHGAEYRGRRAGSIGHAAAFSFYPGKNQGAYGEGGALTTGDSDLADSIKMLRDHGQSQKYHHAAIGWNARMDGIQAAVLSVKLKHLDGWNQGRRNAADLYSELLEEDDRIILPYVPEYSNPVFHVYSVRVSHRDAVIELLKEDGIGCGIHYPIPVHLQSCFSDSFPYTYELPVSEKCAGEYLSLPMFEQISEDQIHQVADSLNRGLGILS